MMQLYPDIPALGSPFGTGNETFGLSATWKRAAAIICDVNFTAHGYGQHRLMGSRLTGICSMTLKQGRIPLEVCLTS